ncbi:uncharacterized protein ACJ7VT_020702 isoform 1-T2 [Polymixia lowei]
MEGTEEQPAAQLTPNTKTPSAAQPPRKRFRNTKRKQFQHSADIVFTKGTTIQTIAPLAKLLKGVTEPVIGLQYIWEYRSPSKSVPPHYQCKLCNVSRLQHDMLAHVKGWKHSFRYIKRAHASKVTCEEEEAVKDPVERKKIKEVTAEVEKAEGRGQLKVILKEPCDVPAFKGLRTTIPKIVPQPGPGMGPKGPHLGGRFSDSMFPGEYPPQGGPFYDFPMGEFGEPGIGGYSTRQDFPGPDMNTRRFSDGMDHHQGGDGFGLRGGRDGFGMGGLLGDGPGKGYHDEFRGNQMGSSIMDRPLDGPTDRPVLMAAPSEGSSLPATLLSYLDTFRIENENDAQIVLKVTQKLTDVLMEYRLRSVSTGPSLSSSVNNPTMSSMGYSSPPSRMSSTGDRYSGSLSGPSRYSDGPSRFYN